MTTESAEKLLDEWEVNSSLFQDTPPGAVPTSVVYPPAPIQHQPTHVVHVPQPQPVQGHRKGESYYLKLAAIVVGGLSFTILGGMVLWIAANPSRQMAASSEQMAAIALTAKPNQITVVNAPICNTMLWGSPCPSQPPVEVPSVSTAASLQSPNNAIAVNQPQVNPRLEEFRKLSLEDLNRIKATTPAETAQADPEGWQALLTAYTEKGGR